MPDTCLARPALAPLCPPIVSIAATASISVTFPPPAGSAASESRAPDTSAAARLPAASRASSRLRSSDAVASAWRCIVPRSASLAPASSFSNVRRATGRSPASVGSAVCTPTTRNASTSASANAACSSRRRARACSAASASARVVMVRSRSARQSVEGRRRSPEGGASRPIASAPRSTLRSRP